MSLKNDGFPSSQAFEEISSALKASDQDRKEAIKNAAAIFAFTLKNDAGKEESWFIDLKQTGTVGKGLAPEGKKPDVTLQVSDTEFSKMIAGTAKAQQLFMSGKLKIKGNIMKSTKLEPVLNKARTRAKL